LGAVKPIVGLPDNGDNSPAIYGWVFAPGPYPKSRQGRQNCSAVPAGLFMGLNFYPALKGWAIFMDARTIAPAATVHSFFI
jgi:hypothetical protein